MKNIFCSKLIEQAVKEHPDRKPKALHRNLLVAQSNSSSSLNINSNEEDNQSIQNQEQAEMPSKKKVLGKIRAIKHKVNSKGEIVDLDGLQKWVNENKFNPNNPQQEVFVADAILGDGSEQNPLNIVLSSRTCLKYLKDQSTALPQYGFDSSFKVNALNYPMSCWVTQDSNHSTFIIALSVCNTENKKNYSFMIQSIMKKYYAIYKQQVVFKYVMSDAALSIFNAIKEVQTRNCSSCVLLSLKAGCKKKVCRTLS